MAIFGVIFSHVGPYLAIPQPSELTLNGRPGRALKGLQEARLLYTSRPLPRSLSLLKGRKQACRTKRYTNEHYQAGQAGQGRRDQGPSPWSR